MFKKSIEKHQRKKVEKFINEPRYTIEDLRVGEICLKKGKRYDGADITTYFYQTIKEKAILLSQTCITYTHIKSKQDLNELAYAHVGDYAITNLKDFEEVFAIYMRNKNLTSESKLSIKQVLQLEDALQTGLIDDLTAHDLFK